MNISPITAGLGEDSGQTSSSEVMSLATPSTATRGFISQSCEHPDHDVSYRETGDYDESKIARCSACGHEWFGARPMNTEPSHPYLAEAARRAASPQTEAECRERIADRAQAAFLSVVKTASEQRTAHLLFEARSVVHDLNQRGYISQAEFDERLIAECKRLVGGDELKARLLASAALFE